MPRIRAAAVAVAGVLALPLFAQDLESLGGIRMRFDAPGARSTAMGGTSEALTDAFGVATNPASLARQRERVAAVETRRTTNDTEYLTGGTVGSFTSSSFDTTSRGVRAAALVWPAASATFAFFYDEPLHVSSDTRSLAGASGDELIAVGVRGTEVIPLSDCIQQGPSDCAFTSYFSTPAVMLGRGEVRLRRYGAAAARTFGRLSLGASAQYADLDESWSTAGGSQVVSERQLTWNGGLQYAVSPAVHFGASYRSGAKYEGERTMVLPDRPVVALATFRTPPSYAAGLAANVTPNLVVAFDAVRVRYSEMLAGSPYTFLDRPPGFAPIHYELPDVTELRAGAEYRLQTRIPVSLRAGWWREPAHRARAVSSEPGLAEPMNLVMLRDQDESHVTAGLGVGSRVRLDAAFDRSENTSRASLAVATTF